MPRKVSLRGFSTIEVVIIVLVVGILGLGGWYVWHKNQKSHTPDKTSNSESSRAAQTESSTDTDDSTAPSNEQTDQYAGWKTYTSKVGSFSFKYPSDWVVTDTTAGSNEYLRLSLESPGRPHGKVLLMFDVIKESFSSQYEVDGGTQTLKSGLRLWTRKMEWSSKQYNQLKPFDCARIRILEKTKSEDVNLPGGVFLSSEGGFCMNQDDYTTKSYTDQLVSAEMEGAIKIYESISIEN